MRRFVVRSTHSNARILKPKRRSRFGQTLSPFDSDEDGEDVDEFRSDGDDDDAWLDNVSSDFWFLWFSLCLFACWSIECGAVILFNFSLLGSGWIDYCCDEKLDCLVISEE